MTDYACPAKNAPTMRIHATTDQDWRELEMIVIAMNAFLRAVMEAASNELGERGLPTLTTRPELSVIKGSKRGTRSTRRKRPALKVVS